MANRIKGRRKMFDFKQLQPLVGALAIAALGLTGAAQAQVTAGPDDPLPEGLVLEVTPQDWLNPPNVPVPGSLEGTMRRQVIIDMHIQRDSAFLARRESFGEAALPRGRGAGVTLWTID
jgi:hypothetical protein